MTDAFLDSLPTPDPDLTRGTGALFREADPRDWRLELLPGIPEALAAGLADSFMVLSLNQIQMKYDQNGYGACVYASLCGAKSIEDFFDIKKWNQYDWLEGYKACGGTGENGISADTALSHAKNIGCLQNSVNARWKISSYMFAPRFYMNWRQTLAAALATSGPCVVATLLPTQFGWDSNTTMSSGYHQMCLVGYEGLGDDDYAIFLNSWGSWWGNNGFCRLKWGYLEGTNFQNNHTYGYKLIDFDDFTPPDPDPDPTPIPKPDPKSIPIILKTKYKKRKKLFVIGDNFYPTARLLLDNQLVDAEPMDGVFLLKPIALSVGVHEVIVINPEARSQPYQFTVEAPTP